MTMQQGGAVMWPKPYVTIVSVEMVVRQLREARRDGDRRCEADMWEFLRPLYEWVDEHLLQNGLPRDWRDRLDRYLAEQEPKGYKIQLQHRPPLDKWVIDSARYRAWMRERAKNAPKSQGGTSPVTPAAAANADGAKPPAHQPSAKSPAPVKPEAPNWPRLTPNEREHAQRMTGLPWWSPFQPGNRTDAVWERIFEDLARTARDRLLTTFKELGALGRMSIDMGRRKEADPERLEAQAAKIQQAYDTYLEARISLEGEWARYLTIESFVGPGVSLLVEKLDAALPIRITGIESALDSKMKAALEATSKASEQARKRANRYVTETIVANWVVTAVEIMLWVGTIKVAAAKVLTIAIQKGATRAAARKAVATYVVKELATAAGSSALAGTVVPEVLSHAGLDETEVQIGLAAYASMGVLAGLAARPAAARGGANRKLPKKLPVPARTRGRGIWDLTPIERWKAVERRLGKNLHDQFPVIDKFDDGIATSIKSLDLGAPTYQMRPNRVFGTVRRYIDQVAEFDGAQVLDFAIRPWEIRSRVLELAVPPGVSAEHSDVLRALGRYAERQGVALKVLEIQ
jgi:hypothetical protein